MSLHFSGASIVQGGGGPYSSSCNIRAGSPSKTDGTFKNIAEPRKTKKHRNRAQPQIGKPPKGKGELRKAPKKTSGNSTLSRETFHGWLYMFNMQNTGPRSSMKKILLDLRPRLVGFPCQPSACRCRRGGHEASPEKFVRSGHFNQLKQACYASRLPFCGGGGLTMIGIYAKQKKLAGEIDGFPW